MEESLKRALQGAHSLLLQDVRVDYNDTVTRRHLTQEFWMILMLVKFNRRQPTHTCPLSSTEGHFGQQMEFCT